MSESLNAAELDNLPESKIKPRSKFSIVWLVPIIAILIGSWLAFKAWSEKGPEISITFKTAEGLEAGKTKIKYKNVEIGEVKEIHVNHDSKDITVIAEMINNAKPILTNKTSFWVVTARIDASGVSGLGTLLSGAFINVDPSSEGKSTHEYIGLEVPPVITRDMKGKRFSLHTKNLGSIGRDVPIYYRKFNVGRVEKVSMDDGGQSVTVDIFVKEPFDQWVNSSTKFWDSSGVDVSMDSSGIVIDTDSIISIIIGGISFDSTSFGDDVIQAENNASFKLYSSRSDSLKVDYSEGKKFVIHFSESVRGLTIGAPVEFRGIQMGEVTDIKLKFDLDNKRMDIPVTVVIDNSKIQFKGNLKLKNDILNRKKRTELLIKEGLRAQLETGNLLTGQLFVSLDFFPDAEPYMIDWNAEYPEVPSVYGAMGAIKNNLGSILKKADVMMTQINEFSYKLNHNLEPQVSEALTQLNSMMLEIKNLSSSLNHNLAPELAKTLVKAEAALQSMTDVLKNDSALQQDLQTTLREFSRAARSMKSLTDYLEKHPESLLKGKKG
ncbi:MAG: MCE family protein [Proteobacteria bacterium]|nr:MCE family protein [Pseudomonadota bacterium]